MPSLFSLRSCGTQIPAVHIWNIKTTPCIPAPSLVSDVRLKLSKHVNPIPFEHKWHVPLPSIIHVHVHIFLELMLMHHSPLLMPQSVQEETKSNKPSYFRERKERICL